MEKNPNNREIPLSWFFTTLRKFLPLYGELLFLSICLRLIGLAEPFFFQVIIDRLLPFQREESLIVVMLIFAAISIFHVFFEFLSEVLGMSTANQATRELGKRVFGHFLKLPLKTSKAWPTGATITRLDETDTIRQFLVSTSISTFLDVIFVFIYLSILFIISAPLTLILLAALPLQGLVYLGFGKLLRNRLNRKFEASAAYHSGLVDTLNGLEVIKSLNAEDRALQNVDENLQAELHASFDVGLVSIWNDKLLLLIDRAVTISIIFFGAKMVFSGQLTLGSLIAFYLIAEKVTGPIENFSGLWESWQNVRVSRQRLGDIIHSPTETFGKGKRLPDYTDGRLEFCNVSFAFCEDNPIITDFDFVAEDKTITLVIGPSGIGKSTFGKIAAGLQKPDQGSVLIGDHDILGCDPESVRKHITYVPQDTYLFSGTIRDNLCIDSAAHNESEVNRALDIACAAEFIQQLPKGLDTVVGEAGIDLSGGQKQRITIARSILKQPSILILDEPTSAVDNQTQKDLIRNLQSLSDHMTLVIITHSPDAFSEIDQILQLEASK